MLGRQLGQIVDVRQLEHAHITARRQIFGRKRQVGGIKLVTTALYT